MEHTQLPNAKPNGETKTAYSGNKYHFVVEKLEGENLEYVKSFGFEDPYSNKIGAIYPNTWVVDQKKKYYLICLGLGQGYDTEEFPPGHFKLVLDEKVIQIQARQKLVGDYTNGNKILWKINRILVPEGLDMIGDEIKDIIRESFNVFGIDLTLNHLLETQFDLIVNPFFVGGKNGIC